MSNHWTWYAKRAEHYRAIEHYEIYLQYESDKVANYPWAFAFKIDLGSSRRGDWPTDITVTAYDHDSKLSFQWFYGLETRDDNGYGSIDPIRLIALRDMLPAEVQEDLRRLIQDMLPIAEKQVVDTYKHAQHWAGIAHSLRELTVRS